MQQNSPILIILSSVRTVLMGIGFVLFVVLGLAIMLKVATPAAAHRPYGPQPELSAIADPKR